MSRRFLRAAVLALVVLAMVFLKVHLSGVAEYGRAKAHLDAGRTWDAIHALDRTMHWYTPVSPHVTRAARDLWAIGESAEAAGDVEQALVAYRTLRSGFYSARSFFTPGKDWIARCDEKITALAAAEPDMVRRFADLTDDERRGLVAESLAKDPAPDVFWSIVTEVGFFGWVGAALAFIWLVLGSGESWRRRPAALAGLAVAVCYALWIVGMMRA